MLRACDALKAIVIALLAAPPARAAEPIIADLAPISVQNGVNKIARLAPDGRDGVVFVGWRDNGNAHGYNVVLVTLPDRESGELEVVRVEPGDDAEAEAADVITDFPHTFEDVVKAFRFARGTVDGKHATLLLVAVRNWKDAIPEPATVTFSVYQLQNAPDAGTTPDHFSLIRREQSDRLSCNADMALSRRFEIPLPDEYRGSAAVDGC